MEKEVTIIVEDDFGRAMTSIKTELSPPQVMDKIVELFDDNLQLKLLLKDSEDQVEILKESNKKLIESLVQKESED